MKMKALALTVKALVLAVVLVASSNLANAAWLVNGIWISNICRADVNPAFFFVYPPAVAQPVGSPCALPNGTPGTVTAS